MNDGAALAGVGEVRSLEALLAHPQKPQVDVGVVAGGASADDDHPGAVAEVHGRRDRVLTGVLEDDPRRPAFTEDLPETLTEGSDAHQPLREGCGVVRVGKTPPVPKFLAVDDTLGAEVETVVRFRVIRD